MGFGERLALLRTKKGLSQAALGKGLGTDGKDATKAVVSGWEGGRHFPKVDQLALICAKLDCGADELLFGKVSAATLSEEAYEIAAQFDALDEAKQDTFKALWSAYIASAAKRDASPVHSVPDVIPNDDEEREDERAKRSLANPPHVNVPAKANKLRRS